MIKIFYRSIIISLSLLLIILIYLSFIGINTKKFNSKIISQFKKIEPSIELKLTDVSAKLDPFNLEIDIKTIGTDLIHKKKIIKIESIKSNISLISFLKGQFAVNKTSISTKSLKIKDLFTFSRLLNNDPKLFVAEQFIRNGYVVADLTLEFDKLGNIKDNYKINGLVKDGQINFFKNYNLNKIDFIFRFEDRDLRFNNVKFLLNDKNITIPKLIVLKENEEYLISGKFIHKNEKFNKDEINYLIKDNLSALKFEEIIFSSENDFDFKINKNFKFKDLTLKSKIELKELSLLDNFNLINIFPNIKSEISFKNHNIDLEYTNNNIKILGKGEVFLQNEIDQIEYEILQNNNVYIFDTTLNIFKNPFEIDLLNYQKDKKSVLELNLKGKKEIKKELILNEILLKEKNNKILINDLILTNNYKFNSIKNLNFNYIDKENLENKINLIKEDNNYLISGESFNVNDIIDKVLNSESNEKIKYFNKNFKVSFDIEKVYLDKKNIINNLNGFLFFYDNKISELNLESKFSNQEIIKFTIENNDKEKVTTLFSYQAKPFVDRYDFIKGFEEGTLDFYSIKKKDTTNSVLKIDNFKVKEIPALAKLLTLASLQGIADLLTGEGIRFTDFEMQFSSKDKTMTISEIYAIGPAISILMEGYIEKNKLISLRGTLVPATTINRTISSIPIIGDILVGKKVGEGVFGVSFKIKGPPKDLETTVNPIKSLTPRFITRTLEKIKKN